MSPMSPPRLGLIVPPAHGRVPRDAELLYGSKYDFMARGLGLQSVSTMGYEQVIDTVIGHAIALRDAGAQAISLMGTSVSFYKGAAFTDSLRAEMEQRTGIPCTTMSHAIISCLQSLNIRRVAVATSYIDEVNLRLRQFLEAQGFEVVALQGLGIMGVEAMEEVRTETLVTLSEQALQSAGTAPDGILISCGGLITLDAVKQLEARHGLPVVSSSPAGFFDLVRLAGLDATSPQGGVLFRQGLPHSA
jgi:arylmalonate decarboxylase